MNFVTGLLTVLLLLAAAGRLFAEAEVRQAERRLERLEAAKEEAESRIDRVRLDVEVLESAGRLTELNHEQLRLRTVRSEQLLDDRGLARMLGMPAPKAAPALPQNADIIGNAIGMVDPALAARKDHP